MSECKKLSVGDLVRFSPKKIAGFRPIDWGSMEDSLIVVSRVLPATKKYFYGIVCHTGDEQLWNYDNVELVSSNKDNHVSRKSTKKIWIENP
jgi:hypothetical protein